MFMLFDPEIVLLGIYSVISMFQASPAHESKRAVLRCHSLRGALTTATEEALSLLPLSSLPSKHSFPGEMIGYNYHRKEVPL